MSKFLSRGSSLFIPPVKAKSVPRIPIQYFCAVIAQLRYCTPHALPVQQAPSRADPAPDLVRRIGSIGDQHRCDYFCRLLVLRLVTKGKWPEDDGPFTSKLTGLTGC